MTIAFGCILAAMFIPLFLTGYAKVGSGKYDNRNPRDFLAKLEGKYRRANNAQLNAYEAFPPFAAGVLVAYVSGAPQAQADILAVMFIFFRILYSIFYVLDRHVLRTVAWFLAFSCIIGLFVMSF